MPFTPAGATAAIAAGLASAGQLGPGAIKEAVAVANGTDAWLHALPVITVDAGTVGAGVGAIPLIVPNPLLIANLTVAFAGQGILGPMAPLHILGLANGLVLAFIQGLIVTTHPGVGVGTAVVRFGTTPAIVPMIAAFAAQGMTTLGSTKMATAIGIALDTSFAALTLVSPIVGPAGPSPSGGAGFGNVV